MIVFAKVFDMNYFLVGHTWSCHLYLLVLTEHFHFLVSGEGRDVCYFRSNYRDQFNAARSVCLNRGGQLARMLDGTELQRVHDLIG